MAVKIGNDEFCSKCMEWREYDEEGKCKVCGKLIKRMDKQPPKNGYSDYKSEGPSYEMDDESGDIEY
jgi:predicted amidophosphoribosyltransferase